MLLVATLPSTPPPPPSTQGLGEVLAELSAWLSEPPPQGTGVLLEPGGAAALLPVTWGAWDLQVCVTASMVNNRSRWPVHTQHTRLCDMYDT
jgi:hypothetical protein